MLTDTHTLLHHIYKQNNLYIANTQVKIIQSFWYGADNYTKLALMYSQVSQVTCLKMLN